MPRESGKSAPDPLPVPCRGAALLHDPLLNKGTAFTVEEREAFGLLGLLPEGVTPIDRQVQRVRENILRKEDALERYIGLAALQDRNETLFYRVLLENIEEFLPIVYTPTVGRACQEWSHIFRRGRGLWITPAHRGRIDEVLRHTPNEDVRLIVVTDNERILGLGDQGAGGMGIPIGKLAIYTAAAGIPPWQTLPISLDVGTDNQDLLRDDLYLGWRAPRLRGAEYQDLVAEFVEAVRRRFPEALLQWEDFKKGNAFALLERYRDVLPSFNDDIQGTAAVTLAAVRAAERVTETPLRDERFLILGAGAAGVGIAHVLRRALQVEGLSGEALTRAVALVDSTALLADDRTVTESYKRPFVWPAALAKAQGLDPDPRRRGLLAAVEALRPTVLIGTSGQPGAFDERVVRLMAERNLRPVILALSNPTSSSEATPQDLVTWSDGRALVATGSPFEPVAHRGRLHRVAQVNNAFVFPALGLAAIVGGLRVIDDSLFTAAADALAREVSESDLAEGRLLPRVRDLREITTRVAEAVLRHAVEAGLATGIAAGDIPHVLAQAMWFPRYRRYVPAGAALSEPALNS